MLNHRCNPPWLGISSGINPGVLANPSVCGAFQLRAFSRPLACKSLADPGKAMGWCTYTEIHSLNNRVSVSPSFSSWFYGPAKPKWLEIKAEPGGSGLVKFIIWKVLCHNAAHDRRVKIRGHLIYTSIACKRMIR